MFCQWTNSTELKECYSLLPDCSASWDYKEDTVLLCFHPRKEECVEIVCCPRLSASNQQASRRQNHGLSSQRIPDQADRKDVRGAQSGGSGKCSYHLHTLAREAVKQDAVQLVVTRVIVKEGVKTPEKQSIHV